MKHKLILKTLVITLIAGMIAVPCSAMAAETGTEENVIDSPAVESISTEPATTQAPSTQAATEFTAAKTDSADVPLAAVSEEKSEVAADNTEKQNSEPKEKLAAPAFSMANGVNGLDFAWSQVKGAMVYVVYTRAADEDTWGMYGTPETHATWGDPEPGKLYYAKVQAMDADNTGGEFSAVKSLTYIPRADVTSLSFNGSANTLTWNSVDGANKYQIAKIRKGDKAYTYYTTTSTSFTDKNVTTANAYYYQVRAMYATEKNGTAYGAWSSTKSVVTLAQATVSLANKSNGIRAAWGAVKGAQRYAVYYKAAEDSKWTVTSTYNTYYPILGVKSGTLYFVQVRPVAGNVSGTYSKVKGMTFIGVPDVTLSNTVDSAVVSWKKVEGANGYQIAKLKKGNSAYSYIETEDTSYSDKDVAGGSVYYYQVRAMYKTETNGTAYGAWSPSKLILRMTQPAVTLSNKSNGIRAEWKAVAGAARYVVYFKTAAASSWSSVVTNNTYYPILNTHSGTHYYVQVRPAGGGVYGPYSSPKGITFIGMPNVQAMTMSNSGLNISWSAVPGATKYQIARKQSGNHPYEYFISTTNSYLDKDVAGTKDTYAYQFRAIREADGETVYGEWSSVHNLINGKVPNGYQIIGGYRYYYKKGVVLKNQIVGSKSEGYYLADANGVCCVSEEMHLAAEFVMNCGTGNTLNEKMKTGFMYLARNYPYKRTYDHPKSKADIPALAIDMFRNKKGNCFRYAACFTCIAKVCGYRSRIAVGNTGNGSPHGWAEVYMDGRWYYFDPDMQLPNYGFPDYYAYKMANHPWNVKTSFRSEVTISNGRAVWN